MLFFFSTDEWEAVQESGHTRDEGARQSGARKSLHTILRCGQTKEGARKKKTNTTGQRRGDTGE